MALWPIAQPRADGLLPDVSGCSDFLVARSKELFSSKEFFIQACAIRAGGSISGAAIEDDEALQSFLQQLPDPSNVQNNGGSSAEMMILSQPDSRSAMDISEKAARILLGHYNVLPAFIGILSNFGSESGSYTSGCSRFYGLTKKDNVFETAYSLKHVEANDRSIKWSIRQMAVYQQYHTRTKHSSCILLQPSENVQSRLRTLQGNKSISKLSDHWTALHQEYIGSLTHNWDSYIRLIYERITDITISVNFAKLESKADQHRVTFKHLQDLHQYNELLIRISRALALNAEVLKHLSTEAKDREASMINGDFSTSCYRDFENALKICTADHIFLQHHVGLVREIADRLSSQLRDTIALQDSNVMLALTQKNITEARTMKTLTFVALIYLPLSFIASFLDLDYFKVYTSSSSIRVDVDPSIWFFLALTVPLLLITVGLWWGWEWVLRRREQRLQSAQYAQRQQIKVEELLPHPATQSKRSAHWRGLPRILSEKVRLS